MRGVSESGTVMSLISLQDVSASYGAKSVLTGVKLAVDQNEIVTIVGPNGSGKSTLLRILSGALIPKTGKRALKAGLIIGYVPQKLQLDPSLPMTVGRFMSLPNRVSRTDAMAALERTEVAHLWGADLVSLSGGQFQRVLLARAIVRRPHVLMLDEPTQGLDQSGAARFYQLIETLRNETGCAIVMVSHDLHVVMSASDRVVCLNGHICCEGAPEVVSTAPEYRALFGTGTQGTLALYRHEHDHAHDHAHHHHEDPHA
jgi:zinc transport system ATP-binding protein